MATRRQELGTFGAAWGPQLERMQAAIYFPLICRSGRARSRLFDLLSPDGLQDPAMFKPRKPLSDGARRAGWQGFIYDMQVVAKRAVRLR